MQTIATQPWPSSSVGYEPTGITLTEDGHLLVTLGRANAVAVYRYGGTPQEPVGFLGLLPTDYFPTDIATVGDQVVVTNTRGIDARGPALSFDKGPGTQVGHRPRHAQHDRRRSPASGCRPTRTSIGVHRQGLRPERLGHRTTSGGQGDPASRRSRCRRASATPPPSSTSSCW